MGRPISTSPRTGSGGQRLLVLPCPARKTVVVYRQERAALNRFKVLDCLPNLLLQWSPREHWWSAEDLLLQALPQPGKFSPPSFIFWYFESRCWRQSSWMGSQWRATTPGASLIILNGRWVSRRSLAYTTWTWAIQRERGLQKSHPATFLVSLPKMDSQNRMDPARWCQMCFLDSSVCKIHICRWSL